MKKIFLLLTVCCGFVFVNGYAQRIATFEVELSNASSGLEVPVRTDLDAITFLSDTALSLVEIQGDKKSPVPFQIENGEQRILYWLIKPDNRSGKHVFELLKGKPEKWRNSIQTKAADGLMTIYAGDRKLLGYQYATAYPPAGIDSAYQRSGFIHPLWSPHGQVLTQIQPADHYHHYGIWNPWTHTVFEADTVDFWNLAKRQGTVRFAKFVSVSDGPIFGEYQALHEHVVFKKDGSKKVALNELQSVRVYQPNGQDYYIADITIEMSCAGKSPVLLLEYRYGGLGWRATEQWNKDNSEVLTSEGKIRKDADGTRARWCIVQGEVDNDYAGVVMMSYPTNYNHPEPLRIWPENQNGRGDMFANFSPTKNMDWLLKPGKSYVLKYRLVVFNGRFTKEQAESAWQNYAASPEVFVKH
jgi:Family of unknown function (DUF6807)